MDKSLFKFCTEFVKNFIFCPIFNLKFNFFFKIFFFIQHFFFAVIIQVIKIYFFFSLKILKPVLQHSNLTRMLRATADAHILFLKFTFFTLKIFFSPLLLLRLLDLTSASIDRWKIQFQVEVFIWMENILSEREKDDCI